MFRFVLIWFLCLLHPFFGIEKRKEPISLSSSVIIPCSHSHFFILPELLNHYCHQTRLPYEIVISLSGIERLNPEEIEDLETRSWPFHLKVLKTEGPLSAGQNRHMASYASSGDILIYQDADDLPHPQRIEMIQYFFECYDVDHILHLWQGIDPFVVSSPEKMSYKILERYEEVSKSILPIHNGNLSILRPILEKVAWDPTWTPEADITFNRNIFANSFKTICLDYPLISYRPFSAFFNDRFEPTFEHICRLLGIEDKSSGFKHLKKCIAHYGNHPNKIKIWRHRVDNFFRSVKETSDWQKAKKRLFSGSYQIAKERLGSFYSEKELQKKSENLSEFILRFLVDQNMKSKSYWLNEATWKKIKSQKSQRIMDWIIDLALFGDGLSLGKLNKKRAQELFKQAFFNLQEELERADFKMQKIIYAYQSLPIENIAILSTIPLADYPFELINFVAKFGPHLSVVTSFQYFIEKQTRFFLQKMGEKLERIDGLEIDEIEQLKVQLRDQTLSLKRMVFD